MKYLVLLSSILILGSCQIKEQAEQLQALEKCSYEIIAADSVYIAGSPVSRFITNGKLNLIQAPALAFAFLQQKIPVSGVLQLRITNPGTSEAGINQFEYKVLLKDTELLSGFVDQQITIPPNGGSTIVPVKIDKDIYSLISDRNNQVAVQNFFDTRVQQTAEIIFKIKPTFMIGTEKIAYPDYININKKVVNTQMINYLKGLNKTAY